MAGVRQFDESAVVEQALEVFWDKGFRATSMLDLAAATGVQRGSLYHAYGGKEQLFGKVFGQFAEQFLTAAAAALEGPDRRQALLAFFDYCVESITTGSPSRGCLSTRTAVEASAPVVAAVRQLLDGLEEIVLSALTRTGDGLTLAVEPREAARLVVAMTRGLAVLERVYDDPARLRETAAPLVTSLLR
ncbi:TetR/AcrR family transcriptional regulator [Kribbella sancticallisti]|uniref:TetR/AcrR family transcriptional regulator n=1 Tax=Kribbella sancticallisti TaxID=460087 RepID=A0ABN2DQH0_9ACTN